MTDNRYVTIARKIFTSFLVLVLAAVLLPAITRPGVAQAQSTSVVINEFLAINESVLTDNAGEFEDWLELHNTSGSQVDLGGWTISDGSDVFTFSAGTTINSGAFLVVWASGDTTRTTSNQIHLPFKLSGSGESLTLVDANGVLSTPAWPTPQIYPAQLPDTSYGVASDGQVRFFTSPTPGATNGGGQAGLLEAVSFSLDHGFYTSAQSLVLTTPSAGATIRYTTNGEVPSATNGTAVASGATLTISETTTVRAIAVRSGSIPSPVETRSYLFTSDIIQQQGVPDGWPSSPLGGRGQVLDFGMDPNVVNGNEATIRSSLTSIPTISIVTDVDNLFDPSTGIYANADQRGSEWERQASVELIDPSGLESGFDIEAGLRIRGGFSRREDNPKHAFRLYFEEQYESALNYPLFGDEGDDRFEIVDLRTASNYAWSWRHSDEATFIDELWSRDTQAAMGQPYTRSRQYHLYLNGTYWGLYMSQERVNGEFGESYFGGDEDDYDVVKRNAPDRDTEAGSGDDVAWKSLFPLVSDLNVTDAEYSQLDSQVDIENLADYYLLHFYTGDFDGSPSWFFQEDGIRYAGSNNWFALRDRSGTGAAGKWQFFDHDSEHSLCADGGPRDGANIDNTTPWNLDGQRDGDNFMSPAYLHAALITHPTYRQIFADRVSLHLLTPGGALTVSENQARLNVRAAEVSPAVDAESARWGDGGGEPAFGRSEWNNGINRISTCFAQREVVVENQLRADGLWPLSTAPTVSPAAGAVAFGTTVTIDDAGQSGTIYVTTDGSDPRSATGAVAATAQAYTGPVTVTGDLTLKARVLSNGQWTPLVEAAYVLSAPPGPVSLALNEFNAVSNSNFLGGGTLGDTANGSDATFGRVLGNGGDWFELVVTEDNLDIRGWTLEVWNLDGPTQTLNASLTLSNDSLLNGLSAGTLITVSEDIADDPSYSPVQGDWHFNLNSNGAFFTAATRTNFAINNDDTQIAVLDATGTVVQLRTGEGTAPNASVSSSEVFKLEATPSGSLTPQSPNYEDGSTSTFGLPNSWSSGAEVQDLSGLRTIFGDVDCDGQITITDALVIAQASVGTRTDVGSCPIADISTQLNGSAADVNNNGSIDIGDALVVAQCSVGVVNDFCRP